MSYEVDFRDLASIAVWGAIELDMSVRGMSYDPVHLDRLNQTLSDLQLKDTDNFMTTSNYGFYSALREVSIKNSPKELKTYQELALEMKLLRMELSCATESVGRSEWARSMLVNLSREFSSRVEPLWRCIA